LTYPHLLPESVRLAQTDRHAGLTGHVVVVVVVVVLLLLLCCPGPKW